MPHFGLGGVPVPAYPAFYPPAAPPQDLTDADIKLALLSFLQGGSSSLPLPRSQITGTSFTLNLPALGPPSLDWLAPACQKVYDLASFFSLIGLAKPKLLTLPDRILAVHQLGQAMGASLDNHQFVWSDFVCYIELTTLLFHNYKFSAVLEYDVAWRKWRRAYKKKWLEFNLFLRDIHLLGTETHLKYIYIYMFVVSARHW